MARSAPRAENSAYIRLDQGTIHVSVWANGSRTLDIEHPRSAEVTRRLETHPKETTKALNDWARHELSLRRITTGNFKPPPYVDPHLDYRATVIPSQLTPSAKRILPKQKHGLRR